MSPRVRTLYLGKEGNGGHGAGSREARYPRSPTHGSRRRIGCPACSEGWSRLPAAPRALAPCAAQHACPSPAVVHPRHPADIPGLQSKVARISEPKIKTCLVEKARRTPWATAHGPLRLCGARPAPWWGQPGNPAGPTPPGWMVAVQGGFRTNLQVALDTNSSPRTGRGSWPHRKTPSLLPCVPLRRAPPPRPAQPQPCTQRTPTHSLRWGGTCGLAGPGAEGRRHRHPLPASTSGLTSSSWLPR